MFSKRDYAWLADFFATNSDHASPELVCILASRLEWENRRFDRVKFLVACGVEPWEKPEPNPYDPPILGIDGKPVED